MAILFDTIRQALGNLADTAGTQFGLPETGLSEQIAGGPTTNTATNITQASTGDQTQSNLIQGSSETDPSFQNFQPATGTTTTTTDGGGGGGGDTRLQELEKIDRNPVQETEYQSLLEQAGGAPSIDFNAIFAPAFEALTQQEGASRALSESQGAQLEQGATQRKQGLETEQESRLQGFGQQRQEAQQQTSSVVEQARRQASELLQGIQARFGGTTGTGRFQSEVLGAQATRNIAQNQAALQNTFGKIGQAENNLRTQVTQMINNEDANLENQKQQLRAQLQQSLADIGTERGRLESEKAQSRIDTLNQYQQVVAQVNARNAQFKQSLFQQSQDAQNRLEEMRAKAQQSYKVNTQQFDTSDFGKLAAAGVDPADLSNITFGTRLDDKSLQELIGGGGTGGTSPDNSIESILGVKQF